MLVNATASRPATIRWPASRTRLRVSTQSENAIQLTPINAVIARAIDVRAGNPGSVANSETTIAVMVDAANNSATYRSRDGSDSSRDVRRRRSSTSAAGGFGWAM